MMRRQLLTIATSIAAIALPVALVATSAPRVAAQAPAAGSTSPTFEVAWVKPNKSGDGGIRIGMQPGGRFTVSNAPLREIIRLAYQVQNFQIVGGPSWITSDRFDIVAKAEGDLPPIGPGNASPVFLMMRSLLADRFHLKVHNETRELPIYSLVLARSGKLGPNLRVSTTDCAAALAARRGGPPPPPPGPGEPMQCGFRIGPGVISAGSMSITQFATGISPMVQRVVQDKTGLTGNYDIDLTYTPEQMPQGRGAPPPGAPELPPIDPNGPSIYTAVQEQLGLKLDSTRGNVDVLVIDSVEQPTAD